MNNTGKEELKQLIKEAFLEAMYEYKEYSRKRKSRKDSDLITTTEAYHLRGRKRVELLVAKGLLKRTRSGEKKNSPQYVSKKRLIELDNYHI